jgi:beta-phosphoglucomutase-like phosphatase (HAD superfamily)
LFDFDGVLTKTATLQAAAWKEMFDAYPREGAARTGERFRFREPRPPTQFGRFGAASVEEGGGRVGGAINPVA